MACATTISAKRLAAALDAVASNSDRSIPRCITVTGSGGKTTTVEQLARFWADRGQSVLVTTSTRMAHPSIHTYPFEQFVPYTSGGDGLPEPRGGQVVLFGLESSDKLAAPPMETIARLSKLFDRILVEGDGARGLPLKIHAQRDPVIPEVTGLVIVIVGLSPLGRYLDEQVMYLEDRFRLLTRYDGALVTPQLYRSLLEHPEGLLKGSAALPVVVFCNQSDAISAEEAESVLEALADGWQGKPFDIVCGSWHLDRMDHHRHIVGAPSPKGASRESI
jgi:probable selenium-dependent hydroxylase accessory protein YqeC